MLGGATAGTVGAFIGHSVRKIVGKFGKQVFSFLGACNDYVSENHLNPIVNKLKRRKEEKKKVDDDYGEVVECIDYIYACEHHEQGIITEGIISSIKEKWDKIVKFLKEFLAPIIKTLFYMLTFTFKKYKIYAEISSDDEYLKEFLDTYDKAAKKANCVDTNDFKPKKILDIFFGLDFVKTICVDLFRAVIEKVKKLLKNLKNLKEYFLGALKEKKKESTTNNDKKSEKSVEKSKEKSIEKPPEKIEEKSTEKTE